MCIHPSHPSAQCTEAVTLFWAPFRALAPPPCLQGWAHPCSTITVMLFSSAATHTSEGQGWELSFHQGGVHSRYQKYLLTNPSLPTAPLSLHLQIFELVQLLRVGSDFTLIQEVFSFTSQPQPQTLKMLIFLSRDTFMSFFHKALRGIMEQSKALWSWSRVHHPGQEDCIYPRKLKDFQTDSSQQQLPCQRLRYLVIPLNVFFFFTNYALWIWLRYWSGSQLHCWLSLGFGGFFCVYLFSAVCN